MRPDVVGIQINQCLEKVIGVDTIKGFTIVFIDVWNKAINGLSAFFKNIYPDWICVH